MIVYAVVDDAPRPTSRSGVELEVFIRREDDERLIEQMPGGDPAGRGEAEDQEREVESRGLNLAESVECVDCQRETVPARMTTV